jgi:SAM-dependent methyltransferase
MSHLFLCCPVCKNNLDDYFYCSYCNIKFPVIRNIPVLINEKNSLFSFDDYNEKDSYSFFGNKKKSKWSAIKKCIPSDSFNHASQSNYKLMEKRLMEKKSDCRQVLIIGGGVKGKGIADLLTNPAIDFTITDVSLTGDVQIVCDAHDLPFKSTVFDGVIVQAVLEHVVDPYRCVEEIHRVLKDGGLIYAETPFMQQVHGGAYDFTRFTWLGHRRLFRKFEEVKSGTCCGPGMALAWSWRYFLCTFSKNQKIVILLQYIAKLTSFFWKYVDYYLKKKPNVIDAASGNYFIGTKKNDYILSDKELIKLYDRKKKELFVHECDLLIN